MRNFKLSFLLGATALLAVSQSFPALALSYGEETPFFAVHHMDKAGGRFIDVTIEEKISRVVFPDIFTAEDVPEFTAVPLGSLLRKATPAEADEDYRFIVAGLTNYLQLQQEHSAEPSAEALDDAGLGNGEGSGTQQSVQELKGDFLTASVPGKTLQDFINRLPTLVVDSPSPLK